MRLLIYSNLPEVGGGSTIVLKVCEILRRRDWEIMLLCRWQTGYGLNLRNIERLRALGVDVQRIDVGEGRLGWSTVRALYRVMTDFAPDVFLAVGTRWIPFIVAALRAARRSLYYYIVHDLDSPLFKRLKWFSLAFDGIGAISPASVGGLRAQAGGWKELFWLPQFSESLPDHARQAGAHNGAMPEIGFLGTLSEGKGIARLLEIWPEAGNGCRLVIAGDGPLRARVESSARAHDNIVYLGSYSAADRNEFLRSFFSRVELLVSPTIQHGEGIQTVILEALSFGCPALSTRLGGTICFEYDWLSHPALPVRLCRPDEIAAALKRILAHELPVGGARRAAIRSYYDRWFSDSALMSRWEGALGTHEQGQTSVI